MAGTVSADAPRAIAVGGSPVIVDADTVSIDKTI
jgi:hypothetical protein